MSAVPAIGLHRETYVNERADPRGLNRMSPHIRVIHARAERWARYARDVGMRAWPRSTLLGRMIEFGSDGVLSKGQSLSEMPEDVANFDKAVAQLGEVDQRVFRKYYLDWAPWESLVKQLRMSEARIKSILARVRERLHFILLGIERK